MQFLPFVLIIAVFWFLIIRPQQKRQRAAQQMQTTLAVDSKVMLSSGIFATVTEITDDYIGVEVAEGVSIKVVRAAISRILPEDFGEETEAELEDEATDATAAVEVPEAADESVEETLAKYTPEPVQQAEKND
ncbi:MAG: preprotein translocase subunit YajC [Nocardioides sp.]